VKLVLIFLFGVAIVANYAYHFFTAKPSDFDTDQDPEIYKYLGGP